MDDLEEQQYVVCTMMDAMFQRSSFVMENYLAYLVAFLVCGENANINQRK